MIRRSRKWTFTLTGKNGGRGKYGEDKAVFFDCLSLPMRNSGDSSKTRNTIVQFFPIFFSFEEERGKRKGGAIKRGRRIGRRGEISFPPNTRGNLYRDNSKREARPIILCLRNARTLFPLPREGNERRRKVFKPWQLCSATKLFFLFWFRHYYMESQVWDSVFIETRW